jgi:hypothetical protein
MSDRQLAARLKRHRERKAYDALVNKFGRRIRRNAMRKIRLAVARGTCRYEVGYLAHSKTMYGSWADQLAALRALARLANTVASAA